MVLIKARKTAVEIVCLYLIFLLLPLYVFKAGQLQLVDSVVFFLCVYYCAHGDFGKISFGKKNFI